MICRTGCSALSQYWYSAHSESRGWPQPRKWAPSLHYATLSHNDIVGYYFASITLLYGITLGLLLIGVWSTFTETEAKVDREASTLAALYLDVSHYPEPSRGHLQDDLRRYTRQVIDVAWPQQRKGIIPTGNVRIVADLANDLAAFEPASEGQKALHEEVYRQFNELVERRRSRVLGVTAGLSASLWALVLIGAVINIAVTWCFHLHNRRMHFWMTAFDPLVARTADFPPGGNGSSLFWGPIGVSATLSLIYDNLMRPGDSAPGNALPQRHNPLKRRAIMLMKA